MTEKRKIVNKLKKNIRRGFTMAELLVVVAIIGILAAFGFVNVYRYQKNLHLTELDDTAREIYVAAQEHLTVAKASGAWGKYYTASLEDEQNSESTNSNEDFLGEKLQTKTPCELTDYPDYDKGSESLFWKTDKHDYRRLTITDDNVDNIQNGILKYLLPAGAIDGTVMPSSNGTHRIVIEYDAKTAVVYAVWYTDGKSGWFGPAKDNSMPDEKMLSGKTKDDGKDARHTKTVRRNSKPQVGYYYGGVHTDDLKKLANDSDVEIVNADKLYLRIALPKNKKFKVDKITAKGEESQIAEELNLNNAQIFYQNDAYEITNDKTDQSTHVCYLLDSVTDGAKGHFASKFKKILPGEDVAFTVDYTTGSQKKVARVSDNSLFASIFQNNSNHYTANIEYGRQLQNLSTAVSNVNFNTDILAVSGARLNNDLNWSNFYYADKTDTVWFRNSSENVGNISLYRASETESNKADTHSKGFYSIDNNELTSLDGNNKKIENIKIQPEQLSKASGLIANNKTNLTIRNLTMKNPSFDDSSNDDSEFSGVFVGTSTSGGNLTINNSTLETDENHNLTMEASKATGTIVGSSESNQGLTVHNVDVKLLGTTDSTVSAGDQNISSTENVTVGNAGGMIGYLKGHADIRDCSITTNSNLSVAGVCENEKNNDGNAGGLIGYADDANISIDKISIKLTDAARDSHGIDINGKTNAGGLIGYLDTADSNNNTIENVEYDGGENGVVQSGSRAAGGFIARLESNGLTISDCGVSSYIYLKKSKNAGRAGGFIGYIKQEQNGTTITRCYYGGRTDNTGKYDTQNKGYDGSSFHKGGYNIINEGEKDGKTASTAGGFIGTVGTAEGDKKYINVSSSYTTGSVYIEDNDGEAGGFVGKASSSDVDGNELPLILQNTYATGIVGSGPNKSENLGAFSGHYGINTKSRNNYYLSGINDDSMFVIGNAGGKNTSFNKTANVYTDTEEKKMIVGSGSTTAAPFISSNSCDTAPYANSLKGKKYPYQFVTELGNGNQESTLRKHIGDWPIPQEKSKSFKHDFAILYYEKVQHGYNKGNTNWYYHGYCADASDNGSNDYQEIKTSDTLSSPGTMSNRGLLTAPNGNEYVAEDGYIILVADKYQSDLNGVAVSNEWNRTALSDAINQKLLVQYDEILNSDKLNIQGYKAYFLNPKNNLYSEWNVNKPFTFYKRTQSSTDINVWDWKEHVDFHYLPVFADYIAPSINDLPAMTVRSASQLHWLLDENLGTKYFGNAGSNDIVTQTMDIDFSSEKVAFTFKGEQAEYRSTPYFNGLLTGTYEGAEKTTDNKKTYYSIKNLNRPLFNGIHNTPGHLKNLVIENFNSTGGLVNYNNGDIENITIINSNISANTNNTTGILVNGDNTGTINNCTISNSKVSGSGLVGRNNTNTITDCHLSNIIVSNGSGVINNNNSGTIEKCTIESSSINGNGFIGVENSGLIDKSSISDARITGNGVSKNISGENNSISLSNVLIGGNGITDTIFGRLINTSIVNAIIGKCGIASSFINGSQADHVQIYSDTSLYESSSKVYFKILDPLKLYDFVEIGKDPFGNKTSTENIGGFANVSYGTISNCSVTGNVYGAGNVAGFIFEINQGNVNNCYSNVVIQSSDGDAGGFAFQVGNGWPTLEKCHSLGEISAKSGAGFVYNYQNSNGVNNSYAALWQAKVSDKYYPFTAGGGNYTNCYYLNVISGEETNVKGITGEEGSQLRSDAALGVQASLNTTKPYYQYMDQDDNHTVYPYPTYEINNYGDWFEPPEVNGQFAYVEYAKGKVAIVYLYDNATGTFNSMPNTSNSLPENEDVKSAYAFLVPNNEIKNNDTDTIKKELGEIYSVKTGDGTEGKLGFTDNENEFSILGYHVFRITENGQYDFSQINKITLLKNHAEYADINLDLGMAMAKTGMLGTEDYPFFVNTNEQAGSICNNYKNYYGSYLKFDSEVLKKANLLAEPLNNSFISTTDDGSKYYLWDGKMPGIDSTLENVFRQANIIVGPTQFPASKPKEAGEGIWDKNITFGPTGVLFVIIPIMFCRILLQLSGEILLMNKVM